MSDIAWDGPPRKPPLGTPLMWFHPLTRGLVGYWLMNEGAGRVLFNAVSKVTNGLLGDHNMWSRGYAVKYHGSTFASTSWAQVPYHVSLRPTTAITISTRVRLNGIGGSLQQLMRGARNDDGNLYGYGFSAHTPALGQFGIGFRAGGADAAVTGPLPTQWAYSFNELSASYDGTTMRIYANGSLVASGAASGTLAYNASPSPSIFGAVNATGLFPMEQGEQAHAVIWNRALSAAEMMAFNRDPYGMFRWPRYRGFAPGRLGSPFFFHRHVMGDHSL